MLERATACLKSGAFRDSLRCARDQPRRSRRLLHSTFWSHGVGGLDLPPYMIPNGSAATINSSPDGSSAQEPFLDFLYPPQALEWLQRKQGQQLQRWKVRNMSRLPEGFIVASRRHASNSYRPIEEGDSTTAREGHEDEGRKRRAGFRPNKRRSQSSPTDQSVRAREGQPLAESLSADGWGSRTEQEDWADGEGWRQYTTMSVPQAWADENTLRDDTMKAPSTREGFADPLEDKLDDVDQQYNPGFSDSPGELAETTTDSVQLLRNLLATIQARRKDANSNDDNSLARRAWAVYRALHEEKKDDERLKQELIQWMATQDSDDAATQCHELFANLPKSSKTMEVYKAIITLQARQNIYDRIPELHQEALENLENGYLISRNLFEDALNDKNWQLAADTAIQHNQVYAEKNQHQVRLFWLYVSDLPKLFENSIHFAQHYGGVEGLRSAGEQTREFCLRFFKEAITQEFIQQADGARSYGGGREFPRRDNFRPIFKHVIDKDPQAGQFMEQVMLAAFRPQSTIQYRKYHHILSYVYQQYCRLPGARPSEELLTVFLQKLTEYWSSGWREVQDALSMTIQKLLVDWKRVYGQVSVEAVHSLLSHYASIGDEEKFDEILKYQDSAYPAYETQKEALWTRIYLHARRNELDLAQQAFAEVARLTREHGDQPDLRCWNVLLLAHSRVDDFEGALMNFQNIIDYAKLEPDIDSFRPLVTMLSYRGDVAGLEDLLDQYDDIVGEPRPSSMMLSLMTAHFQVDDNVAEAEDILQKTIAMKKEGAIVGSLTPCFNALMNFYAIRRDIDAATRVYRWMREEKVLLDGETFGALLQTLLFHRHLWPCYRILRKIMPEHHVQPTAYHFALMMAGFNHQGFWKRTVRLHADMLSLNIRPSVETNVSYLKAKASLERVQVDTDPSAPLDNDPVPLEATLNELKYLIAQRDRMHVASKPDTPFLGRLERQDSITPYFNYLIYIHGARRCFDAVEDLLKQYTDLLKDETGDDTLPIRMLTTLMAVHWQAGEHDKVEECWKLAIEQARDVNRTVQIPRFILASGKEDKSRNPLNLKPPEPDAEDGAPAIKESSQTLLTEKAKMRPKPYPGTSAILDKPLRWYIRALMSQARVGEAIKLVSQLLTQGYFIGRRTWNIFIRQLLNTQPPLTFLAFVLTERFMMPHFPGWVRWKKRQTLRRANRAHGLQLMRTRYVGRTEIAPEYRTMVLLGQAMLYLRRIELTGDRQVYKELPKDLRKFVGTIKDLRVKAKETVYAVNTIPPMPPPKMELRD